MGGESTNTIRAAWRVRGRRKGILVSESRGNCCQVGLGGQVLSDLRQKNGEFMLSPARANPQAPTLSYKLGSKRRRREDGEVRAREVEAKRQRCPDPDPQNAEIYPNLITFRDSTSAAFPYNHNLRNNDSYNILNDHRDQ